MPDPMSQTVPDEIKQRQDWMAVLAKAEPQALEKAVETIGELPHYTVLRAPEPGMVMVQGRAGGRGQRFNLGEMTVTRCSVQLTKGIDGHAYVAGRNLRHAELAALCDAMLQSPDWHADLQSRVIQPMAEKYEAAKLAAAKKANATKVNFFTMVRGEDQK